MVLKAAQTILPDSSSEIYKSFGKDAKGLLIVDAGGHYSLKFFRPDRAKFASGEKSKGTPEGYSSALLGISTYIGRIELTA